MALAFRDSVDAMIGWEIGKWGVVGLVKSISGSARNAAKTGLRH
jgi:hypothetical protein